MGYADAHCTGVSGCCSNYQVQLFPHSLTTGVFALTVEMSVEIILVILPLQPVCPEKYIISLKLKKKKLLLERFDLQRLN